MYSARYKDKSNMLTPDFGVSVRQSKYYIQIKSLFVFSVSGFQSVFIFVLVSEIGKCYTQLYIFGPLPSFHKGGGGVVKISAKNGDRLNFSNKKGRVGKIVKQEVSLIFILTNLFQCYHSPSVWCAGLFYLFIPFLSVFFVFHEKNLILLNLINIYMIFPLVSNCRKVRHCRK